jgi:hypothetical protein
VAVLSAAAEELAVRTHPRVRDTAGRLAIALREAAAGGRPAPWALALGLLASLDAATVDGFRDPVRQADLMGTALSRLRDRFTESADDTDLAEFIGTLDPFTAQDPVLTPVALPALAEGVTRAFDPTVTVPPVLERVWDAIGGADRSRPMAPPEPCGGLDRPVWNDVRRAFAEWLLPGAGEIGDNRVVPLVTNPEFIDAFLCGLNTQLLAELRWRNIRVATGCTPLRRFWDRFETVAGTRADDIVGLAAWTAVSSLGDPTHRPGGASGRDFVVAGRGQLFLRYPATTVFMQSATHDGTVAFDRDPPPGAPRIMPGFQGRLGADIVFFGFPGLDPEQARSHWLVFEEPPAGYRFANDRGTGATTGHDWAAAALAPPVRVLIAGEQLLTNTQEDV